MWLWHLPAAMQLLEKVTLETSSVMEQHVKEDSSGEPVTLMGDGNAALMGWSWGGSCLALFRYKGQQSAA